MHHTCVNFLVWSGLIFFIFSCLRVFPFVLSLDELIGSNSIPYTFVENGDNCHSQECLQGTKNRAGLEVQRVAGNMYFVESSLYSVHLF